MKRRWFALVLALCLLPVMPVYAAQSTEETVEQTTQAAEEADRTLSYSGVCGEGILWKLENGTLTVSGSGEMDAGCPWEAHKDSIEKVVFAGGVTKVGAEAFRDCDNLTDIDFGNTMKEIDANAFYDCDGLREIRLPDAFRRFGPSSFQDCSGLTAVYCTGGMPSFRGNCLWNGNHITIYTLPDNPWPQDEVATLVNNFGGRLSVVFGGEPRNPDPQPTEETAAPEPETQPVTEPTALPEPETVTETAPETTEAAVIAEAMAITEATEAEVTAEPETTAAPTEETDEGAAQEGLIQKAGSSGWLWMVLVAAGLTAVLILALIIRMITHKDGKYSE